MGHPIKFTDRNKEWFQRRAGNCERRLQTREERERFLIVCEGEKTEPNYFEALSKELPPNVIELQIHGAGANTLSLVAMAQEIRDNRAKGDYPFDEVWVVFDRDSFAADDFDNAITMAESDEMECAWSNEAFELWYILHFQYRSSAMSRTAYRDKLTELLGEPYKKNDPDMFKKLAANGNQTQAVAWARKLHNEIHANTPPSRSNPCTTVSELVNKLNSFKA